MPGYPIALLYKDIETSVSLKSFLYLRSLFLFRICLLQLGLQDEDTATDTFLNGFLVLL